MTVNEMVSSRSASPEALVDVGRTRGVGDLLALGRQAGAGPAHRRTGLELGAGGGVGGQPGDLLRAAGDRSSRTRQVLHMAGARRDHRTRITLPVWGRLDHAGGGLVLSVRSNHCRRDGLQDPPEPVVVPPGSVPVTRGRGG